MHGRVEGDAIEKDPPALITVMGCCVTLADSAWLVLGIRVLGFHRHGALGSPRR